MYSQVIGLPIVSYDDPFPASLQRNSNLLLPINIRFVPYFRSSERLEKKRSPVKREHNNRSAYREKVPAENLLPPMIYAIIETGYLQSICIHLPPRPSLSCTCIENSEDENCRQSLFNHQIEFLQKNISPICRKGKKVPKKNQFIKRYGFQ